MCDRCGYPCGYSDHFGEKMPDQPAPTVPTDEELHNESMRLLFLESVIAEPYYQALRQVRDRTEAATYQRCLDVLRRSRTVDEAADDICTFLKESHAKRT